MQQYESFGECLRRCLAKEEISASEAARLVGFRSRNSIFRILSGDTSHEVNMRFLDALYAALGESWPEEHWAALEEALSVERLGPVRYQANRAFLRALHTPDEPLPDYVVHIPNPDGTETERSLQSVLAEAACAARTEIIMTSCCEKGLSDLLAVCCEAAGEAGRLNIRHYIDTRDEAVTQNILGILPLVGKQWYNARLVEPSSCPREMQAFYRLHSLHIHSWDEQGNLQGATFLRYDHQHFILHQIQTGECPQARLLDRWRFQLELLKPMPGLEESTERFIHYVEGYAQLEDNCTILSIKPDVHFNCIPSAQLEQGIRDGFSASGMAAGGALDDLIAALKAVHEARFENMMKKHKPTHLIYSLPAMERFMRTGVLCDHFFLQRPYTVEERREIIRVLLDAMRNQPYFNVHFFKEGAPPLRFEISLYDGKGVLLTDAYTGYDLEQQHSEALITLPAFVESFKRYFLDELLVRYVIPRADTLRALERLLIMNISD
ncbi:MAG: hypothetical protein IJB81_04455 [Clostridia bacterium]|nr:hypothetical protein [Clostridia bacterium]